MTPRQAFTFGFLLRCADENLDPAATQERIKQAAALVKQAAPGVKDTLSGITSLLTNVGAVGLAGSAVVGGGLGWGAAKLMDTDASPEQQQNAELVNAYKIQAARARQARARRGFRQKRPEFMLSPTT